MKSYYIAVMRRPDGKYQLVTYTDNGFKMVLKYGVWKTEAGAKKNLKKHCSTFPDAISVNEVMEVE